MKAGAVILAALGLAFGAAGNDLPNPSFDDLNAAGFPSGWRSFGLQRTRADAEVTHSGSGSSLWCSLDGAGDLPVYNLCAGLQQNITYGNPTAEPIHFGVWTRADGVYCGRDYECCISVRYDDGTWDWSLEGESVRFPSGTYDWRLGHSVVYPKRPVAEICYHVYIRKGVGRAWFDDGFVERGDPGPIFLGCRRMTDRPLADSEKAIVELPADPVGWTSEAGGLVGSGTGGGFIEVPVPRAACTLNLRLFRNGLSNEYAIALAASTLADSPLASDEVRVWTADSLRRVTPLTFPTAADLDRVVPPDGTGESPVKIAVAVARGGAASAQLLATAGKSAARERVSIALDGLAGTDGTPFGGTVKWERVASIPRQFDTVLHPASPNAEERYLPDPLLPAADFRLRANSTQSAWFTFTAARDAAPGTYRATACVSTSAGESFRVPVEVRVLDYALPVTFGMDVVIANMEPFTRRFFPNDAKRMDRVLQDLLLDYRLNCDNISRWDLPDLEDVKHAVERGASRFNVLGLLKPPSNPNATVQTCPSVEEAEDPAFAEYLESTLDPYVAKLREEGLMKYAYLYGFDERDAEYYPAIDALWKRLKARYPDLPLMTTARMYKDMAASEEGTGLANGLTTDWYCPLTSAWKRGLTEELHALGKKVWWYVCCGPLYPFANFAPLENPWSEARVLAWQQYMEGSDGLLYWAANWWTTVSRLDASDTIQSEPRLTSTLFVQGDGVLIYPGTDTAYPSIRLSALRDGVQDYEHLRLVEAASSRADAERLCTGFVRSLTDFDRTDGAVRAARSSACAVLDPSFAPPEPDEAASFWDLSGRPPTRVSDGEATIAVAVDTRGGCRRASAPRPDLDLRVLDFGFSDPVPVDTSPLPGFLILIR